MGRRYPWLLYSPIGSIATDHSVWTWSADFLKSATAYQQNQVFTLWDLFLNQNRSFCPPDIDGLGCSSGPFINVSDGAPETTEMDKNINLI